MKTRTTRALLGLLLVGLCTSPVRPAPITLVDTGEPPAGEGIPWDFGDTPWNEKKLAAEFEVTAPVTITTARAFIDTLWNGSFSAVIRDDGGMVPGAPLYSTVFAVAPAAPAWGTPSWQTADVSSLGWTLSPGTYWISFEGTASGGWAYLMGGASSPLLNEASKLAGGDWTERHDLDLSIQLLGTSIPDGASTLPLLGLAIALLATIRSRRRANRA